MTETGARTFSFEGVRSLVWRRQTDLLALGVLVLVVFCFLSPALKDGSWFAPSDIGRGLSDLTSSAHAVPNHNDVNGDIIDQGLPWYLASWQAVHHGQLPLWSSLSATGMPEFLNFESGVLALPSLIGYLFPASVAFLVTIGVKLLIAGVGTYLLLRLVGARPAAALFGGVSFMLSGQIAGWLGWSISGVFCWVGAILAGLVYCFRGTGRIRELWAVAVPVAFALYGGFPEGYLLVTVCLAALAIVAAAVLVLVRGRIDLRAVVRVGLGVLAGLALAAPLWFAGLPVLSGSVRRTGVVAVGMHTSLLTLFFAQGYDGLPTQFHPGAPTAARFFGSSNYYESVAYIGVLAVVLALVALVLAWRRPIVIGLAACGATAVLIAYEIGSHGPVQDLVRAIGLSAIDLDRVVAMADFALACLAGIGLELVLRGLGTRRVGRALLVAGGLVGLVLVALAVGVAHTAALYEHDRLRSLIWPIGSFAVATLVLVAYVPAASRLGAQRARRLVAVVFVGLQGAFVLFAGVGINSYATNPFPQTAATTTVQHVVGTSILGLDTGNATCPAPSGAPYCGIKAFSGGGFYPNINLGYSVDELGLHDPVIPRALLDGWPVANAGQDEGGTNIFTPDIDTAALAHDYGAAFVLAVPGATPPKGMHEVAALASWRGTLHLYGVPNSGRFEFAGGSDTVSSSRATTDASYTIAVSAPRAEVLKLALTDFTGWHARANGHALAVRPAPHDLLEVTVPAGTRTITLTYWPRRLSEGLAIALLALLALVGAAAWRSRRARRLVA